MKLKVITASAFAVAGLTAASPALAGPVDQDGLVNVILTDVNVQVPVALAANICDVAVNVVATQVTGDETDCEALANAEATNNQGGRESRGRVDQSGLVNLFVDDLNIQVPVSVAANLCNINVNVLALQLDAGDTVCVAQSDASAQR